jgi:DNA-binding LacI/PurR family transcriptional regulator/DNA-binding transcriptional regulator YhcF (GntR family)
MKGAQSVAEMAGIPRYTQIRDQLRRKIETGELAPGMRLPPENELFKLFDASNTTVLRALKELVQEGLIIRRQGSGTFVTEQKRPPLIPGRALKLGILWMESVRASAFDTLCHRLSLGAFNSWGVQGVEPELDEDRARTYTRGTWRQPERGLIVECLGNEPGGRNRAPSLEVVQKAGYDGVLALSIIEEPWLEKLLALKIPTVIVDFPTQRFATQADLVYADPQSGYRAAVDHFVQLGLKRIHFVGANVWDPHTRIPDASEDGFHFGKRADPDSFLRLSAWRQAMDAHRIEVSESWMHFQTNVDKDLAPRLAAMPEAERPQALVCHDVNQAERLQRECATFGLNIEAAGACHRPYVGRALDIGLSAHDMGAVAGELLLARLKQPSRLFLNVGVRMVFCPGREEQLSQGSAGITSRASSFGER